MRPPNLSLNQNGKKKIVKKSFRENVILDRRAGATFFRQDNGVKFEASTTGNDPIKTFTLFFCKLDRFNAIKNLILLYKMV